MTNIFLKPILLNLPYVVICFQLCCTNVFFVCFFSIIDTSGRGFCRTIELHMKSSSITLFVLFTTERLIRDRLPARIFHWSSDSTQFNGCDIMKFQAQIGRRWCYPCGWIPPVPPRRRGPRLWRRWEGPILGWTCRLPPSCPGSRTAPWLVWLSSRNTRASDRSPVQKTERPKWK